ncbi:MAG: GTP-binding protein [Verrucomicrobia bacterium]|nr:GTP-binding protein [Verrucomicrobiota bacterium]
MTGDPAAVREPLPLILLTGFLGAGKTTLLLRWLEEAPATGRRLGVVMNEFGAESVDSRLIGRPGLALQQVSGGCVCCAPDNELPNAVTRLVKEGGCDAVVVETSGLADPDNVIDVLTDHDLLFQVRLQAVVTVVDGPWYAGESTDIGERVLARRQLEFAQVACLSKCDRMDAAALERALEAVRAVNPTAALVKLPYGLPDLPALLSGPSAQGELTFGEGSTEPRQPHLHSRYQSVTWRFPVPVERPKFEAFLAGLDPRQVVRAKGFVRFRHAPEKLFLFQTVWGHHVIDEFPALPHPEPVAVLIGPGLDAEPIRQQLRTLAFGSGPAFAVSATA